MRYVANAHKIIFCIIAKVNVQEEIMRVMEPLMAPRHLVIEYHSKRCSFGDICKFANPRWLFSTDFKLLVGMISNFRIWRWKYSPLDACVHLCGSLLQFSSLHVWQLWDTAIGDTRKNILNKTCFSNLCVCNERPACLGWAESWIMVLWCGG